MMVIYGYQRNLDIEDLSDSVARPFRIQSAVIDLNYGAGRGALIMDLTEQESTGGVVDCTIMDRKRFGAFIMGMGVASARELSGRSVVGFVRERELQGVVANEV